MEHLMEHLTERSTEHSKEHSTEHSTEHSDGAFDGTFDGAFDGTFDAAFRRSTQSCAWQLRESNSDAPLILVPPPSPTPTGFDALVDLLLCEPLLRAAEYVLSLDDSSTSARAPSERLIVHVLYAVQLALVQLQPGSRQVAVGLYYRLVRGLHLAYISLIFSLQSRPVMAGSAPLARI